MASKALSQWLAARATPFAGREGASQADKMMCICIESYTSMLSLMDASPRIMSENQATEFKKLALRHLRSYAWMHKHGLSVDKHVPGKRSFLLIPKLHHLWHLAFDVCRVRINPRATQLCTAESFVGVMGRIGKACHRSTVSKRTLERYLCKLHLSLRPLSG